MQAALRAGRLRHTFTLNSVKAVFRHRSSRVVGIYRALPQGELCRPSSPARVTSVMPAGLTRSPMLWLL